MQIKSITKALLITIFLFALPSITTAGNIIKSPNNSHDYEAFTLPNKLKVIIVSDPDADKAAASLDVNVGYFNDPKDRQGLAHFLEHMLFLGTQKYPDANSYREFINAHGGSDNAFTGADHTNYFFDIDKDHLDEALDRFSQFFIHPLFNEEFTSREVNAVNSEYKLKIKDDGRREWGVFKETANNEHPFTQFSVGNLQTLQANDTPALRSALISFHKKNYSANLMTLAVIGKEPLPVLKKMVRKHFSAINNKDTKKLTITEPLLKPNQKGVIINVTPIKDNHTLSLSFSMPWSDSYYLEKPTLLISHLIGHEGKGSLRSLLKEKGWINGISTGNGMAAGDQMFYTIDVDMTAEGTGHSDEIVDFVFQYIKLVKNSGLQAWALDEIRRISDLDFNFQEPSPPTSEAISLASNLHNYPMELVMRGPFEVNKFNEGLTRKMLSLMTADNMRLFISDQTLETNQNEKWYGTPYSVNKISAKQLTRWNNVTIDSALKLPTKNIFIPDDTTVKKVHNPKQVPTLIIDKKSLNVWHMQDHEFKVPRADIYISIDTKSAKSTAIDAVQTSLYIALVRDSLDEFSYPALLAGLYYSVNQTANGIGFSVSGFDNKQPILIDKILDTLLNLEIQEERFLVMKKRMIKNWKNTRLDRPYQQTSRALNNILHHNSRRPELYLDIIGNISVKSLKKHIPKLLNNIYIEIFGHGNITEEETQTLSKKLSDRLFSIAGKGPALKSKATLLENNKTYLNTLDIDHEDSSIVVFYQGDQIDINDQAKALMLKQLIKTSFFSQLRTEKQLGYVVYVGYNRVMRLPGLRFVIQSPETDPAVLLKHIETFIDTEYDAIEKLSDEAFAQQKQGLLTLLKKKDKRLSERSHRFNSLLNLKYYKFDQREKIIKIINNLNKEELLSYYKRFLQSGVSRQLIIQSIGNSKKDAEKINGRLQIKDIESFKRDREFMEL